jgi:hypothetical protein
MCCFSACSSLFNLSIHNSVSFIGNKNFIHALSLKITLSSVSYHFLRIFIFMSVFLDVGRYETKSKKINLTFCIWCKVYLLLKILFHSNFEWKIPRSSFLLKISANGFDFTTVECFYCGINLNLNRFKKWKCFNNSDSFLQSKEKHNDYDRSEKSSYLLINQVILWKIKI